MLRNLLIIIVVLFLLGGAYFFIGGKLEQSIQNSGEPNIPRDTTTEVPTTEERYTDSTIGLSFTYAGDDAYHIDERTTGSSEDHVKTIVLTERSEYEALANAESPREGPPTITISVFQNTERMQSEFWARQHPQESGIERILGDAETTVVGGANAVRYIADGLYAADTIVVAHGSFVYVLSGSYIDETSPTKRDFEPLVRSLTFIPEPGVE